MSERELLIERYQQRYKDALLAARLKRFNDVADALSDVVLTVGRIKELSDGEDFERYSTKEKAMSILLGDARRKAAESDKNTCGDDLKSAPIAYESVIKRLEGISSDKSLFCAVEYIYRVMSRAAKPGDGYALQGAPVFVFLGNGGRRNGIAAGILAEIYHSFGYLQSDKVFDFTDGSLYGEGGRLDCVSVERCFKETLGATVICHLSDEDLLYRSAFVSEIFKEAFSERHRLTVISGNERTLSEFLSANPTISLHINEVFRIKF